MLVVLANKQDMEGCMSVAEVHQALGLEALKNRTFQVCVPDARANRGDQSLQPPSVCADLQNVRDERRRTGRSNGLAVERAAIAEITR